MPFFDPTALQRREIAEGAFIRPVWGDKVMMVYIDLKDGAVVPLHTHPHEQMGMVLEGEFELVIEGESKVVREGEAYLVPSNIEHTAIANRGDARALDIFSPPREDFIQLVQGSPTGS